MIVDIKIKGVWIKADILGITGGGGTLDEVLAEGATLNADRTIELDNHKLDINDVTGGILLRIDPANFNSYFGASDGTASSTFSFVAQGGLSNVNFEFACDDGTTDGVKIKGDAVTQEATHTALSHKFEGKINNNTLQEFADDAAAVTGGLLPGDFYYTNDAGSGFLKVVLPAI